MTNGKLQFTFCFSNRTIDITNFVTFLSICQDDNFELVPGDMESQLTLLQL